MMITSQKLSRFKSEVFHVDDPICPKCHEGRLDFNLFEDYQHTNLDWVQWYCKANCGFFKNVE
ncbi:MAG: hypothetical protein ACFFCS_25150, partial [Candidatus Hodarchaeota archaeon]